MAARDVTRDTVVKTITEGSDSTNVFSDNSPHVSEFTDSETVDSTEKEPLEFRTDAGRVVGLTSSSRHLQIQNLALPLTPPKIPRMKK